MKRIYWSGEKGERYWEYLRHIPAGGRPFCDLFAMPGGPLFFRAPAPVETINDWNGQHYAVSRVMQSPEQYVELEIALLATPYEQTLLDRAWGIIDGRIAAPNEREYARAVLWAHYNVLLASETERTAPRTPYTAFRNPWLRDMTLLETYHWRLMHAQIDEREPCECFAYWDTPETVFAVDIPYRMGDWRLAPPDATLFPRLLAQLARAKGSVTLFVYPDALWDRLLRIGWSKLPKSDPHDPDIYLNPACQERLCRHETPEEPDTTVREWNELDEEWDDESEGD